MTTTTSTTATASTLPAYEAPNPFEPVGDATLDRQDFMTLFITQMQHQDPLEPMDSYEMASQLAQFSNMEATMKMADNMEKLLEYQTSQNNLQLLTLIGKGVVGQGNFIGVTGGHAADTEFTLADAASTCSVEIYDAAGRMVDSMDLGYAASGSHTLSWDATTPSGNVVSDGQYSYVVRAYNEAGQEVEADYRTTGQVTGLTFNGGKAQVMVDGAVPLNVSNILRVTDGVETPVAEATTTGQTPAEG
ncbi:MAG: flagellar hook assembly protein FlgD [Thermodesulfobacteriota bacterium]